MANHCDNTVIIKADWEKLKPFITKSDEYNKSDQPDEYYKQEGDANPTEWNTEMNGLKIDWLTIMNHAIKNDMYLRVFYTYELESFIMDGEEYIIFAFESAWDFPVALESYLNTLDLPMEIACVENGCEIEGVAGEDFGLSIAEEPDEDGGYAWKYIEYSDELARALGRIE